MEDILAQSLTTCLINIQRYSKDDKDALLYFCLNQSSLSGGLRSNVQVLNQNSISSMVSQFMSTFHRFLSSNAEMPLDSTFEVYFHVASAKYINKPSNRRKAIPLRSLVGANNQDRFIKCVLPGSLVDIPRGSPANPECFKNSCLLASLAYLILQIKKPEVFKRVKPLVLQRSNNEQRDLAARLLTEEIDSICLEQNLSPKGPHELGITLKSIYQQYNIQTIVIMSMRGCKPHLTMWPEDFDQSLPRVYLLAQSNALLHDHVLVIQSLATFFAHKQRAICFFCQSFYYTGFGKANKAKHKCRSAQSCQRCFGIFEVANSYQSKSEPWVYCNTKMAETPVSIVCSQCGFDFKTALCFENHKRFCDKKCYFWQCPVCQKSVSMQGKDLKQIEESHHCSKNEKFCLICLKYLPKNHICIVAKASKSLLWPNLAVLGMVFQDINGALCQVCYQLQLEYMKQHKLDYKQMLESKDIVNLSCDNHIDKKCSLPNIIKLCYESDRFQFRCQTFSDESFLLPILPLTESINLSYCSQPLPRSNFSSRKRKQRDNSDHAKVKGPQSAANQLLNFFIEENLRNYTVLVQTNQEMLLLLEVFLENFWHPSVVQSGRVIKKISLSDMDLSFVLFENYCKGHLGNWLEQFEIKRPRFYFPSAFNDPKYHGQVITKPEFSHFQCFTDTAEDVKSKIEFYKTISSTIDVNLFLYQTLSENLKSFLMCVTKFIEMCFELQTILKDVTNGQESHPIHPLDPKIMSLSSFAMAVFKYFYLNHYDVKSVLNAYTGCPSKSSAPEYEYLVFLSYTKTEEAIQHAFNTTEGQQRFRHILVDGYSSVAKTVYQFHGCQVNIAYFWGEGSAQHRSSVHALCLAVVGLNLGSRYFFLCPSKIVVSTLTHAG